MPHSGGHRPDGESRGLTKHWHRVYRKIQLQGLQHIDTRTQAARAMLAWAKAVQAELGPSVTTLQRTRIETASRTRVFLEHLDAHLLKNVSLFSRKASDRHGLKRHMLRVLALRQQMADDLDRACWQLTGADKPAAPPPPLSPSELLDSLGQRDHGTAQR